jgi:septum formation protein
VSQAAASPTPPWLYLASQSPRRRQLLDQLGVPHRLLLPDADEDAEGLEAEIAGEAPLAYVQRVTHAKWQAAMARLARWQGQGAQGPLNEHGQSDWPDAHVLCADTTVALGTRILGKPRDAEDAAQILSALSGQRHQVMTAVVVAGQIQVSVSDVHWRTLSADEIARYVASGEPMGKAGAYAIQGRSGAWTRRIEGSYSGIMGLPLFETAELLSPLGWHF